MSGTNQLPPITVIIILLMIVIVIRIRRVIYGTKVSVGRAVLYICYYFGFAGLVLSGSYFEGVPLSYFAIYVSIFAVSAFVSFKLSRGLLTFWKGADASIYSKGALPIYLTYVAGLILRISIGYIFVGPNFLFQVTTLSGTALLAIIFSDIILVIGAGLLVGRNLQLISRFRAYKSGKESINEIQT
jgi:hypothetical protein